ncbi:MAG: DNA starvation/stationary phase protection protein [Flavobacteriales bacterium]|nr:DNA starvation/stationary phase protection protein [Flavobacteriales bacterium]
MNSVVTELNNILANYHVHYQKLRNFHWNVEGPDFFELHEIFEQEYEQVKLQIDEIAERIRVFDEKPYSTLKEYLEVSKIKEVGNDLSSEEMVKETISDFKILISLLKDATKQASNEGDLASEDLLISYIKRTEQKLWMLTASTK